MKRALLLFSFVALVFAGVASASRDAEACCQAGETIHAQAHTQGHGEAHHKDGGCCEPKAGETKAGGMCMRGENGSTCCTPDAEGAKACCADGVCACCAEGTCATKHQHDEGGCCQQKADGQAKAGCCAKKDGAASKGRCCAKPAAPGTRS